MARQAFTTLSWWGTIIQNTHNFLRKLKQEPAVFIQAWHMLVRLKYQKCKFSSCSWRIAKGHFCHWLKWFISTVSQWHNYSWRPNIPHFLLRLLLQHHTYHRPQQASSSASEPILHSPPWLLKSSHPSYRQTTLQCTRRGKSYEIVVQIITTEHYYAPLLDLADSNRMGIINYNGTYLQMVDQSF